MGLQMAPSITRCTTHFIYLHRRNMAVFYSSNTYITFYLPQFQSISINTINHIQQHRLYSHITSFIKFTLIILLAMQHLLRLLNLSLSQSSQQPSRPLVSFKRAHLQRLPSESDPSQQPVSQRLNFSLQHQRSQRQEKSTMRAKGISQSQRIAADFQGRNNSIRISKHTYRINHNPYVKSETKIIEQNNSSHRETAQLPKNGGKKMATIEIVGQFQQNSTIFSRKKKNDGLKRQNKVLASPKERISSDGNRMRHKKSKLLKLVGVGCKIFEANPIRWRKPDEVSPSQAQQG